MEFVAHRGASYAAPENTPAAFNLAWERNADIIELDIHLSRDGQIVVMHDPTTWRTAGRKKPVVDQTLAQLKSLDAGSWKGEKWAGQKIPTLAEALATVPNGRRMLIEIKCGTEVVPELKRVVNASGLKPSQTLFGSFDIRVVRAAKKTIPDCPTLLISDLSKDGAGRWTPSAKQLIDETRKAKLDGLNLLACDAVNRTFVRQVKAAGLLLYVWTVDKPTLAEQMIRSGVDGIITNRQQWLRRELDRRKRK